MVEIYDPAHAQAVGDFVSELAVHKFQGVGYEGDYERDLYGHVDMVRLVRFGTHVTGVELWRDGHYVDSRSIGSFDSALLAVEAVRLLLPPGPG